MNNNHDANYNNTSNLVQVMQYRHAERKDTWGLKDEVLEGAIEYIEANDLSGIDGLVAYDNLAINAEIVEKNNAEGYDPEEAIFETEHYYIFNW